MILLLSRVHTPFQAALLPEFLSRDQRKQRFRGQRPTSRGHGPENLGLFRDHRGQPSRPLPSPPSTAVGRALKYQVVKNGMCGVPPKESSRGTDRELRAGLSFMLQRWRWLAGGRNHHRCPVICPLAGAGSWPCMEPTSRYGPELTPGPGRSAGYLGASGRPEMRWTMWVGPTLSQATRPQPHETPIKFLEHTKHFSVSGPAFAQGVPSASGSLHPRATSSHVSSQKGLPA